MRNVFKFRSIRDENIPENCFDFDLYPNYSCSGIIYDCNHNYKFDQIKENMKLCEARNIVGKPDESKYFGNEIMDVYYYFPLAEARFFYSKNDSTLIRSWRTDAD